MGRCLLEEVNPGTIENLVGLSFSPAGVDQKVAGNENPRGIDLGEVWQVEYILSEDWEVSSLYPFIPPLSFYNVTNKLE